MEVVLGGGEGQLERFFGMIGGGPGKGWFISTKDQKKKGGSEKKLLKGISLRSFVW